LHCELLVQPTQPPLEQNGVVLWRARQSLLPVAPPHAWHEPLLPPLVVQIGCVGDDVGHCVDAVQAPQLPLAWQIGASTLCWAQAAS
jgi:hypothetical protein